MDAKEVQKLERSLAELNRIIMDLEAATGMGEVDHQVLRLRKLRDGIEPLVAGHGTGRN